MRNTIICTCLLLVASFAHSQPSGPENGKICGIVLDESGDPASNVRVIAMLLWPGGHSGGYPGTHTDKSGRYCIDGLPLGSYILSGDDEGLGYPMQGDSFFSWPSPAPQVTLTSEKPNANFDWKIPFRAGFLYLRLPASDSAGVSITAKLVVRSRPSLGRMSITTVSEMGKSKQVTILLPSQEDVLLSVSASGYESWPGDNGETKVLKVLPGAIVDIVVPPLKRKASR